jgi:hypothetical protein
VFGNKIYYILGSTIIKLVYRLLFFWVYSFVFWVYAANQYSVYFCSKTGSFVINSNAHLIARS